MAGGREGLSGYTAQFTPLTRQSCTIIYCTHRRTHAHTPGDRGPIGIGDLLACEHRGRSVDVHVRGSVRAPAYGGH